MKNTKELIDLLHLDDLETALMIACSLPPLPNTNTFIKSLLMFEMSIICEHHFYS